MPLPIVVWFTGLPSSGKTALARRVRERLLARGTTPVLLDGDELRPVLVPGGGYDDESRAAFYEALGKLAVRLSGQGAVVLVSATANRRAFRDAARAAAPRFVEVFLDVPPDEARRRDHAKGLYDGSQMKGGGPLPGVGAPYERPEAPEITATGAEDDAALEAIVERVEARDKRPLDDVYVALRVPRAGEVARAQQAWCERFGLVPRPELHVTLSYLGPLSPDAIGRLATLLFAGGPLVVPRGITVEGVGGALRDARDESEIAFSEASMKKTRVRKVAWWALSASPELLALQRRVTEAAALVGARVEPSYYPHVTLGSNAPLFTESRFDVHGVEKRGPLAEPALARVPVDRLHVTDTAIHPESLLLLALS